MPENSTGIDLTGLEEASLDFETKEAARRKERHQHEAHQRQREDAAWKLLGAVTRLDQDAAMCNFDGQPFDPMQYTSPLIDGFFEVCTVMREEQLGSELESLDEERMIELYGKDRDSKLARAGYRQAINAIRQGIAHGRSPALEGQLKATVENIAGRHLWYMMYPVVRGLVLKELRVFRIAERDVPDQGCETQVEPAEQGTGRVMAKKGSQVSDERSFMEMAIDEARQSKAESGRKDSSPFVGVVVVKDGEVLGKAHRGELGAGEHAEFTVLEKKLHDKSVAGATVFCTLEPCTTRHHPKWPCAEWLVARKVGRIVIAMLDPNPAIRGLGEQRLREAGIDVQRFPKDLADQVEEMNRQFIREQKAKATRKGPRDEASAITQGSAISTQGQSGGQAAHSIINFGISEGRLPPKLILKFDQEKDTADQANTIGLDPSVLSRWIRIRVTNPNGRKVARNCIGHLEEVMRLGPQGSEDAMPNGGRPMNWEHLPDKFERDIHAGAEHRLDVLHAAHNENRLRLSVKPGYTLEKPGTYELTIRVSADDADSEFIRLRIRWEGEWSTLGAEDARSIRK